MVPGDLLGGELHEVLFDHVADLLEVRDHEDQRGLALRLLLGELLLADADEELLDVLLEAVDDVVARDDLALEPFVVVFEHGERVAQRLKDDVAHAQRLAEGLAQRDGRRVDGLRVQIDGARRFRRPVRHQSREEIRGDVRERQEDGGEDHVEERVGVRDLSRHVGRGLGDEVGEQACEGYEQDHADHFESGVRGSDAQRLGVLTDSGEERGRSGADVRAEDDRDRARERHDPAGGER